MQTIKFIKNTLIPFMVFIGTSANAIVVSDPTSYGYYIEQLKSATKQIQEAQKQLTEAKRLNTSFDKYMEDLKTSFDFVGKTQNMLKSELKAFDDYKSGLTAKQQQALNFNRKYDLKDLRDIIDTNLDGVFVDPTNPDYEVGDIVKLRTLERQKLIKNAIIKNEEKLLQLGQRYKDIDELANKSKNASSSKEALDINNALLIEILAAIHSLIDITATTAKAEMATKFTHYAKDKHQQELKKRSRQKLYGNTMTHSEHRTACHEYKNKNGHSNTTIDGQDCPDKALIKIQNHWNSMPDYAKQDGI